MSQHHRIAEIKGLNPTEKAKLSATGLKTVEELLARAQGQSQRASLAKELGVPVSEVTEWINRADLMRINGVGREFSNLLENAGVDSCKELQHRVAENLHAKLKESNAAGAFTKQTPGLKQIQSWIAQAKTFAAG
jgi:predicted flap endonuclease-1-like 5' DNA nuclease